jgi:hypothetical protein
VSAKDEYKDWSKNDLIREVIELREKVTQLLRGGGNELTMESGARSDGKPFVTMRWGMEVGQLSPAEARLHGLRMLEVAEGAETDGATVAFLTETGMGDEDIARYLMMLRDWRGQYKERQRGGHVPDGPTA